MIISKIVGTDFIYLNLHAEEVISTNYIEDGCNGIFVDRLTVETVKRAFEAVKLDNQLKTLVLNFRHINACQKNLNKTIIDLKNEGYKILFINLKKAVCEDLALTTISNSKNTSEGDVWLKYFFFEDGDDPFTNILVDVDKLYKATFQSKIKPFIDLHKKPHASSFVYLTSYVDIKKLLSHEKDFMLFSLYKLANKIRKEWDNEIFRNPILVCQSMNSAYIVSVLSNLLLLDILILDKIGPINKLYNRMGSTISADRKYIVVSDLVCLGTEVKIVKNLVQFMGGKYLGNVSLIKIETLADDDITGIDSTKAVFSINRSNNRELNYNITTNLEQL
ncbi:MAG: hypothetical protein EOO45_00515 [Flavobacterium sp.]|nr:MAG: hypothetical protein EOO45_00515 [Flavobacterium sp.]